MNFCTAINCMDGRVQLPVIEYLKNKFDVEYVDNITEAGPSRILAEQTPESSVRAILDRLNISINKHNSVGVAVVGHHDCAGNPVSEARQRVHIQRAMHFLRDKCKELEVIGLWVDENWQVHEVAL